MVTPEDMKANAEFIHLADHHVDVPGTIAAIKSFVVAICTKRQIT